MTSTSSSCCGYHVRGLLAVDDGKFGYVNRNLNCRKFYGVVLPPELRLSKYRKRRRLTPNRSCCDVKHRVPVDDGESSSSASMAESRRGFLIKPLLVIGGAYVAFNPAFSRAADESSDLVIPAAPVTLSTKEEVTGKGNEAVEVKPEVSSRVYDATVIGEPQAIGKDRGRVWEKMLNARVVYLGEAEHVPIREDKDLELEVVKNLRNMCFDQQRSISVALEAFPCNLQEQLNQYMSRRIDGEALRSYVSHWPPEHWSEYEPLLSYCRENGVRLVACGTPLEILRTVQAEGIRGLNKVERKTYAPPAGGGFISGFSRRSSVDSTIPNSVLPFGPSSYLSAQARVVEEYTMSQVIMQALHDGGSVGMLVVVTGASHVVHGSRGVGLPARISKKLQKKNQVVILLNPERQYLRKEGEVPVADFLWYSAARPCNRNCFDRAEIARVMNAASRRRDALPEDLQKGLDLGLVSPEVLQNFFDLEKYPLIAKLTQNFQGFRERLLADPKFLHRLAIEESISITTTLIAQYERRKENFFEEIDYVLTDTIRGSIVDFFTVWLPAPTLSFSSFEESAGSLENFEILKGFLGSVPDNAFQTNSPGKVWTMSHRVASVLIGGAKLAGVGFVSSIGAVAASNALFAIRRLLNPVLINDKGNVRSPILKTALVYGSFLGTSANLRYQVIAGLVEHRIGNDLLASSPNIANLLSFVVRTINSYWATQQWIDLARYTGLQSSKSKAIDQAVENPPQSPSESEVITTSGVVENSNNADSSAL